MEKFQKVVATGFLFNANQALIVKRSENEKFLPGYWELPGGKVDFGEDPKTGLVREYQEEVGLSISVGNPFRTFSYVSSDGNRHTIEIIFVCTSSDESEIQLSPAHTEYKWIAREEVDSYNISDETKISIKEGFDHLK